jgi:DNA-damage-inducible protein J
MMLRKESGIMATKTANLYARIEPDLKEQAESILTALGVPASNAITMFYRQIVLHRGLPFDVTLPADRPVDISCMTAEEIDFELEKGYQDMLQGKVRPAKEAFASLRKDYDI